MNEVPNQPRDSLMPWAPNIPERWRIGRGFQVSVPVRRPPRDEDEVVTAFRDGEVTLRSNRRVDGFTEAFQEHGYQGVRPGELVIHGMDGFAGAIGVSDAAGKMTPVVHIHQVRDGDPRYFAHALRVAASSKYIQSLAKGIRERSTAFDRRTFQNMALPIPPAHEQAAIADFLDRETARIDTLIEKQQMLIERLMERRRSLVAAMVTGGSSHEQKEKVPPTWFDQMPSAWTLTNLGRTGNIAHGKTVQNTESPGQQNAPYIRAANVQPDGVLALEDQKTMWFSATELKRLELREGDVVVVEGGSGFARAAYISEDLPGWGFQNHIHRIRPTSGNDGRFLTYSLLAARETGFPQASNNTVSMPNLTAKNLAQIPICLPSVPDQRRIANFLDIETQKIGSTVTKAQEFINLAKERRSALITATVTGQIDVMEDAGG